MTILKKLRILIFINVLYLGTTAASTDGGRKDSLESNILTCSPSIMNFSAVVINSSPCCEYSLTAEVEGGSNGNSKVVIEFGDGSPNDTVTFFGLSMIQSWTHQYCTNGVFTPTLSFILTCFAPTILIDTTLVHVPCVPIPCFDCISSFAPIPGKKYLVSAWAKESSPAQSKTNYTYPSISILYPSISGSTGPFAPSGQIIDGWQRIEGEFTIPANATDLTVRLNCSTSDCFYDDVRVLPFDGSMKSYVYDPVNMRLVAELDERNYATFYEYDEEGKLIRIKKETEKGKMTIKENRDNTKK